MKLIDAFNLGASVRASLPFVESDRTEMVREMWTKGYRTGQRDAQKEQKQRASYNGWTNYATWVVNLWIDNDQSSQEFWSERAEELVKSAIEDGESEPREEAARNLADEMKERFDEDASESAGIVGALSDLLSYALEQVQWQEIAEHYTNEIELFAAGWNMPGYMPDSEPAIFTDADDARQYILDELESQADSVESEEDAEEISALAEDVNLEREEFTAGPVAGYVYWVNKL